MIHHCKNADSWRVYIWRDWRHYIITWSFGTTAVGLLLASVYWMPAFYKLNRICKISFPLGWLADIHLRTKMLRLAKFARTRSIGQSPGSENPRVQYSLNGTGWTVLILVCHLVKPCGSRSNGVCVEIRGIGKFGLVTNLRSTTENHCLVLFSSDIGLSIIYTLP